MLKETKGLLRDSLQLGDRIDNFTANSPLLGAIPEFDSMAVVTVLTLLEERFDVIVEDDEITAEIFETIGSLEAFVRSKVES